MPLFGLPFPGRDPFDLALMRKKYPELTSPPQRDTRKINDFEEIQREETYGVFRAWTGPKKEPGSISFIVKFAVAGSDERHQALRQEATIYHEQIPLLQGTDIPKLYGYYEGTRLNSNKTQISCIFLEDCGKPIFGSFVNLPLAHRAEILKKIGRLHLSGMTLDYFYERNVVREGDLYRLIGFKHVELGHQCPWDGDKVYEGEFRPDSIQLACGIMYSIGLELCLWKSRLSVKIFGKNRPRSEFPTQEAIDTLCEGIKLHQFQDEDRLHNWLKKYKEYQDQMTPEEFMEKFERPNFTELPKYFERDDCDS
ncbi:hypothetical protein SCHPADRAFT_1002974 [Schizopora paradoxa]|uniref:Protein kinase domain-containing protein n=1 Tax=Schizopora paradoxa TaxID=27342 RepID=A0A0H2R777_9AGAM|nr:hypothetical protein SCHPADRAFT_1002974 [Schizopora paradoxa]